jgi:hypothetical protein
MVKHREHGKSRRRQGDDKIGSRKERAIMIYLMVLNGCVLLVVAIVDPS